MFALPSVARQRLRSHWSREIFIDVGIERAPLALQKHRPWTTFPDQLDLIQCRGRKNAFYAIDSCHLVGKFDTIDVEARGIATEMTVKH